MRIEDFDFDLPEDRIAQQPVNGSRDQSRLMVLSRSSHSIIHKQFFELLDFLRPGDVLIMNNSKVFPARVYGKKKDTGGNIEILLLHRSEKQTSPNGEIWEAMIGGNRIHAGVVIECGTTNSGIPVTATIIEQAQETTWRIELNSTGKQLRDYLDEHGHIPIPPYIDTTAAEEKTLRGQYQTIYAKQEGSVAAPTAGLHFSPQLVSQLAEKGIETAYVTLHVGIGTFAPVKVADTTDHNMHSEYAIVSSKTAEMVNTAKQEGRRVIAVGTTSVRTLESFMNNGVLHAGEQWTNIFITPGYTFQCIDGMITNFHLPKSTLLLLVSAFAGTEYIQKAYQTAIKEHYRFYSFGDAMLIL